MYISIVKIYDYVLKYSPIEEIKLNAYLIFKKHYILRVCNSPSM